MIEPVLQALWAEKDQELALIFQELGKSMTPTSKVARMAQIAEARALAEYILSGPLDKQPTMHTIAVTLNLLADSLEETHILHDSAIILREALEEIIRVADMNVPWRASVEMFGRACAKGRTALGWKDVTEASKSEGDK